MKESDEAYAKLADNERWMREVLTDFKIPFDDHEQGRRLALVAWMADHQASWPVKRLLTQKELGSCCTPEIIKHYEVTCPECGNYYAGHATGGLDICDCGR
jgi:hypothetical protein